MDTENVKTVLALILAQVLCGVGAILTQASLTLHMNILVCTTYSNVVAAVAVSPFPYLLERTHKPNFTPWIFSKMFLVSLAGLLSQISFIWGLSFTGSTFTTTMNNMTPAVTFALSAILRLEKIDVKTSKGNAKLLGIVGCVMGAMIMTFYYGPVLIKETLHQALDRNLIIGSCILVGGLLLTAASNVFQVYVIRDYPALLSLTALQGWLKVLQCVVLTLAIEGTSTETWNIGWDLKLLTYLYTGVLIFAIPLFVTIWAIPKKGPVFVSVFTPLSLVISAILECLFLHGSIHLGSVIGALVIVVGLYLVLWGQSKYESLVVTNAKEESANFLPLLE